MQPNILLVRYGEVFLKGQNRPYFINSLVAKVKQAVMPVDGKAHFADGRIYVRAGDIDDCARRVSKVFGVHSVSPAIETEKEIPSMAAAAISLMKGAQGSFKILARRSDKTFPMQSPELAALIGGEVLKAYPHLAVDVKNPQHVVEVEVRDSAYVHKEKLMGAGGMPIGTGGKALLLISGGIDSPVSGYMIAKRGVALETIHFFSHPYTSEHAKQKVISLLSTLAGYCGTIRMHVVPFTKIQMDIYEKCPEEELTVIMRRFMMRISERLAQRLRCKALVTGESVGQVASQTMDSLICTDRSVNMLVLRPLVGFDKAEIIDYAHKIGTYETSILPYEDCCTVFTPKHPVTKPRLDKIERSEALLDVDELIEEAIAGIEVINIDSEGAIEDVKRPEQRSEKVEKGEEVES
jgi:thiamine biosynthesis protein ThiI